MANHNHHSLLHFPTKHFSHVALDTCEVFQQSQSKRVISCVHFTDRLYAGDVLPADNLGAMGTFTIPSADLKCIHLELQMYCKSHTASAIHWK